MILADPRRVAQAQSPAAIQTDRQEAIAALRQAAENRSDPQRDLTIYNLAEALRGLGNRQEWSEARELIQGLVESKGHYRKAWYIKRALGVFAWDRYTEGWQKDEPDPEVAAEAAKWYCAAIRARPRFKLFFRRGQRLLLLTRFVTPPIMFANARDGREEAGQRRRARWNELRFYFTRRRLMKRGIRRMKNGQWNFAAANFDWVGVVGRNDSTEIKAQTLAAIAWRQAGDVGLSEAAWFSAFQNDPVCALFERLAASEHYGLPEDVPGPQPNTMEEVAEAIEKHGIEFNKQRFWHFKS